MAEREAAVKLTLDNSQFLVSIKRTGEESQRAASKANRSFNAVGAGVSSLKSSFLGLGSTIKGVATTAGTLGGALALGSLVQQAAASKTGFIQLAGAIEDFTGSSVRTVDVQKAVEGAASATKSSFEDVQRVMGNLANAGSVDQVRVATERALLQAKRFNVEGQLVSRTYSRLIAKGVADSADEAERLTEQMFKFGRTVLGVDPDEAIDPNDIAEFASFVNAANSNVTEMTTLLSKTGSTAKDLGQSLEIVEELGLVLNSRKGLKELRKEAGLSQKQVNLNQGAVKNLLAVIESGSPKAFKALQDSLATDRSKQAIEEIVGREVSVLIDSGKTKEARAALVVAGKKLRAELEAAGKGGDILAKANKRNAQLLDTPAARLQESINTMREAFQQPEILNAIDDLAEALPSLAKTFAGFVSFAAKNPLLAGALGIGLKGGAAFLGGMAKEVIKGHVLGGASAGKAIELAHAKGGGLAAGKIGKAGKAFGVAAIGAISFGLVAEQIDKAFAGQAQAQGGTAGALASAEGAQSAVTRQKALKQVEAALAKERAEKPGLLIQTEETLARGGSQLINTIFGAGLDVPKSLTGAADDRIAKLEAKARDLRKQLAEGVAGPKTVAAAEKKLGKPDTGPKKPQEVKLDAGAPKSIGTAVGTALGGKVLRVQVTNANEIGGAGAGGGSRGPLQLPSSAPGSRA